ncbi:entericidin A/B family lipoprotein [Solirhodobacter olei]|jgi:predicted small secreted protein|uniref:entericidin A/B family lipoprotein n=1 Tax=Solirhodobacter olei TaxID=2493082 RepID=UPI000FD94449|nr:entericidin A/B family lipoprotein [Solirhodobacter olei]
MTIRRPVTAAVALLALLSLAACDTMAGAGKDISKAGNALTSSAKQTQQKM